MSFQPVKEDEQQTVKLLLVVGLIRSNLGQNILLQCLPTVKRTCVLLKMMASEHDIWMFLLIECFLVMNHSPRNTIGEQCVQTCCIDVRYSNVYIGSSLSEVVFICRAEMKMLEHPNKILSGCVI